MAKVWSERGENFGGSARQARDQYQKKERELEDERTSTARLQAELRAKKEELARSKRGIEKRQIEILQLERITRSLGKAVVDLEHRFLQQKARVSRIEHEVERAREDAFRRRSPAR